ncbi:WRKY transcription factor 55 [Carex littledalei]|uniref:WRKY transcription factor 55 n=1 Tax=Carex littledalei TaxID=544730 RepID=A0A833VL10_9POAL|nr:WRKY transcription factor 55 [Carex littledalei]
MAFSSSKNKDVKQECDDLMCGELFPASSIEFEGVNQRSGMRKSRKEGANIWTIETSAPFDDGYQWRKYGTKKIMSSNNPRSYFRCTYRDDENCVATKQVQQKDFTDPPVYEVTYKNSHSCNLTPMSAANLPIQSGLSMTRPNLISVDFSISPVHLEQYFSAVDSKPCQNLLNVNQGVNLQFHNTTTEFTSVGSRTSDLHEKDALYCESLSDYLPLQGLDELDGFDDLVLREFMNSSDMNSCG